METHQVLYRSLSGFFCARVIVSNTAHTYVCVRVKVCPTVCVHVKVCPSDAVFLCLYLTFTTLARLICALLILGSHSFVLPYFIHVSPRRRNGNWRTAQWLDRCDVGPRGRQLLPHGRRGKIRPHGDLIERAWHGMSLTSQFSTCWNNG